MSITLSVSLVSPEKVLYEGKAISVIAPCSEGYLGILVDHAPLVAKTAAGVLRILPETGAEIVFEIATEGFLEVRSNHVTFLLNSNEIKQK